MVNGQNMNYNLLNSHHERNKRSNRALELMREHPDWTRKQISAKVKEELGMGVSPHVMARVFRKSRKTPVQRQGTAERIAYAKSILAECANPKALANRVKEKFGVGIGMHEAGKLFGRNYVSGGTQRKEGPRTRQAFPKMQAQNKDEETAIQILLETMPDLIRLEVHEDGRVTFERRQIVHGVVRYK